MNENEYDYIIVWEAPKIVPPEFRLYYDDKGAVVCYTCEKLEGNYVVIDALTFAEARPDIRVIDGKVSRAQPNAVVSKLMPNKQYGKTCAYEDISIIVDEGYTGKKQNWKLTVYELR